MKSNKISLNPVLIIVSTDDWEGIYLDGELIYEDHRIHNYVWIELIKEHGAFSKEVENYWVDEDYMCDFGNFPNRFKDIPKEMLS
jgi:hypothetical protein